MKNLLEIIQDFKAGDYQKPLDGHGLSYRAELVAEYQTLATKGDNKAADQLIQDLLKKPAMTWDDLMSFELALIKLVPLTKLRRKAASQRAPRSRYH